MKMITKITAVILAIVMTVFAFASCGGSGKEEESSTEGASGSSSGKVWVIASDNAFAPFEFLDSDSGKYIGIDMDIMAAIAEDQGFQYKINNIGFDAAMSAVQSNQADGVIAGATITDERKKSYDFSDGYFDAGQAIVVAADSDIKSIEDLNGKTVAAKASTAGATYAQSVADKYGFKVTILEDSPTMYQGVMQGQYAACFEDEPVARYSIVSQKLSLKVIGDTINPAQYGFAVKKGQNTDLLNMFNAGLADIKANGKYDEILAKYGYNTTSDSESSTVA